MREAGLWIAWILLLGLVWVVAGGVIPWINA
jgi:hypothetical protein